MNNVGGIILAAGKGKRMNSATVNKVVLHIGDKPMIFYAVKLLKTLSVDPIIVVVGFAKESVIEALSDTGVSFVEQAEQLGTADAVKVVLQKESFLPANMIVIQGDDAFFYKPDMIKNLIDIHIQNGSEVTFLTIQLEDPTGLGRIIRDESGTLTQVVEEKDATDAQRQVKEVNPACYIFDTQFLKESIVKIKKSEVTSELYLTAIIDIAIQENRKIQAVPVGFVPWRGVNTIEELEKAKSLFVN